MFQVALYQPEIPPNTGNISRLCVGACCALHLVGPLGFSLADRLVRRAGLDHWGDLDLTVHDELEPLLAAHPRVALFSKRGAKWHWEHEYRVGDLLLFGRETTGLPADIIDRFADRCYALPVIGPVRSLNLGNSVAAVVYEGLRQLAARGELPTPRRDWDTPGSEYFDVTMVGDG